MSTCMITFADIDDVEYDLEIQFDFQPEEKACGPSYASGGEPGYPAHVESCSARCLKITTAYGPATLCGVAEQIALGEKLLASHNDAISELVLQAHAGKYEWNREQAAEAAQERREELRREQRMGGAA